MNALERAIRNKYRWDSNKGQLTLEQLWDLPLQSKTSFDLDNVAKEANRQLKAQQEESFVNTTTNPGKQMLEDKLAIVISIIETKQAENAAARNTAERAAERQRLIEILALRNQEELMKLDPAELQKRIDALSH